MGVWYYKPQRHARGCAIHVSGSTCRQHTYKVLFKAPKTHVDYPSIQHKRTISKRLPRVLARLKNWGQWMTQLIVYTLNPRDILGGTIPGILSRASAIFRCVTLIKYGFTKRTKFKFSLRYAAHRSRQKVLSDVPSMITTRPRVYSGSTSSYLSLAQASQRVIDQSPGG